MFVDACSSYAVARYLLCFDIIWKGGNAPASYWRRRAAEHGLDISTDQQYHQVWIEIVHFLMSVFKDHETARKVSETMLNRKL